MNINISSIQLECVYVCVYAWPSSIIIIVLAVKKKNTGCVIPPLLRVICIHSSLLFLFLLPITRRTTKLIVQGKTMRVRCIHLRIHFSAHLTVLWRMTNRSRQKICSSLYCSRSRSRTMNPDTINWLEHGQRRQRQVFFTLLQINKVCRIEIFFFFFITTEWESECIAIEGMALTLYSWCTMKNKSMLNWSRKKNEIEIFHFFSLSRSHHDVHWGRGW